jgi:hypothetical protein
MRNFYIRYEYSLGGPRYENIIISLENNEKANPETFNKKLDAIGGVKKKVLSWSLIED